MEGKMKVSFGIKTSKQGTLPKKAPVAKTDVEYISSFDATVKPMGAEIPKEELVIPSKANKIGKDFLEELKKEKEERDSKTNSADNGKLNQSLEALAVKELMQEAEGTVKNESKDVLTLPVLQATDAQEATLEDYENIPVEDFGKAMLRGMGWNPTMGIGKTQRCREKPKTTLKRQKTEEVRYRMGTGGGPPRRFGEDPIPAQVETIDPYLDEVIEETYDSDYHHLVTASRPHPVSASSPVPSPSPSHSSPSPSPTRSFFLSSPINSSSSTVPECRLSESLPASATASASTSCTAISPSSKESCQPRKKARTAQTVVEEELKARLAIVEEERIEQYNHHMSKMRQYKMEEEIAAEELKRAVAERKLAEARLRQFLVVAPVELQLRPKGMGLGADKMAVSNPVTYCTSSKDDKALSLGTGCGAQIVAGTYKGLYGKIVSHNEDSGRCIVKLEIGGSSVSVNENLLKPVSKEEYATNGRVLNADKFRRYKESSEANQSRKESSRNEASHERGGRKSPSDSRRRRRERSRSPVK